MRAVAVLRGHTLQFQGALACCCSPLKQLRDVWLARMQPRLPWRPGHSFTMQHLSGTAAATSIRPCAKVLAPVQRQLQQPHCFLTSTACSNTSRYIRSGVCCRSTAGIGSHSTSPTSETPALPLFIVDGAAPPAWLPALQLRELHTSTAGLHEPTVPASNGYGDGPDAATSSSSSSNGSSNSSPKPNNEQVSIAVQQQPAVSADQQPLLLASAQQQEQQQQEQAVLVTQEPQFAGAQERQQLLPKQLQQQLPQEVLLIGIDPDTNGAIAVVRAPLHWTTTNGSSGSSSSGGSSNNSPPSNGTSSSRSRRKVAAAADPVSVAKDSSSSSSRRRHNRQHLNSSVVSPTSTTTNSSSSSSTLAMTVNGSSSAAPDNHSSSSNSNHNSTSSAAEAPQLQAYMSLPAAVVRVYDMPVQTIVTKSKTSTGKLRVRRRLDILQAMAIIRQVLQEAAETAALVTTAGQQQPVGNNSTGTEHARATGNSNSSSSSGSSGSVSSSSSSNRQVLLRAVVEVASIQANNTGSLAILNQGYSLGAWTALLPAHGFDVTTVHVLSWKRDFGLLKQDKDSSRELARQLFAQAGVPQDHLLRTKNTHGRAEALLLAAWGLGWSAEAGTLAPSQGPLRATVNMSGGRHILQPLQQQQGRQPQQQQGLLQVPSTAGSTAAAAAAAGAADLQALPVEAAAAAGTEAVTTSDDESPESLFCQPSSAMEAVRVPGAVTWDSLAAQLQAFAQQQQQRAPVADVASELAAVAAAAAAKAAAKQAEKEARAAARRAAVAERAAARAAEKAARQAARAAEQEARQQRKAAEAAAKAAATRSRQVRVQTRQAATLEQDED